MSKVKNRRIHHPSHVRSLMQEQINILRNDDGLDPIDKARAIAYLSNTALSAYKDGELLEKVKNVEALLKEKG
ncbi:MAG TPA: hypothetical protein VK094_08795 [Pseudogracilibacillus sp.]|nr:hypothetical protein [Pseudogracilibacillus sp.]